MVLGAIEIGKEPRMSGLKYFGKYRGFVVENNDPQNLARIKAQVPEVFGDEITSWALPCMPFTGYGCGFYMIPEPGAGVWIEFEAGDPSRPIWSGGFWTTDQIPRDMGDQPARPMLKIIQGTSGMVASLDDERQTITLSDAQGVNHISIQVEAGQVRLKGAVRVVIEAPQIELVENGMHPLVLGDALLQYLNQLVSIYQSHLHPGEMVGTEPVVPAPPVPPIPKPTHEMLSKVVKVA
jgi:uncharacterized protein involved in type VI secretion and phage assembly